MATTAIATRPTLQDCQWSRPGCRLFGVEDQLRPGKLWVCVRIERRGVTEEQSRTCPSWEAVPAAADASH
jgi:hypothetical protein